MISSRVCPARRLYPLSLSPFILLGLVRELLVMLDCLAPDFAETRILRTDPPTVAARVRTVIRLAATDEPKRLPRIDERLTYLLVVRLCIQHEPGASCEHPPVS